MAIMAWQDIVLALVLYMVFAVVVGWLYGRVLPSRHRR